MHFDVLFKAGILAIWTVGEPGAHGAGVTGMQGMGVSTPFAAAVAEATAGLVIDRHMPNGIMLTMGLWSMIFAAGIMTAVRFAGSTVNTLGAVPKEHWSIAPPHTNCPMGITRFPCKIWFHSTIIYAVRQ